MLTPSQGLRGVALMTFLFKIGGSARRTPHDGSLVSIARVTRLRPRGRTRPQPVRIAVLGGFERNRAVAR